MSDPCRQCGACCRQLIIEASALDVAREPLIALKAPAARDNPELPPEDRVWILAVGQAQPCPFLRSDARCNIYPTRPNACVAMDAGGEQCQSARQMEIDLRAAVLGEQQTPALQGDPA